MTVQFGQIVLSSSKDLIFSWSSSISLQSAISTATALVIILGTKRSVYAFFIARVITNIRDWEPIASTIFFDMFAGRIKSAILANFRDNYCQQMIRGKLRHLEFALFKALQRTYWKLCERLTRWSIYKFSHVVKTRGFYLIL